jgi:hypothetical protein
VKIIRLEKAPWMDFNLIQGAFALGNSSRDDIIDTGEVLGDKEEN